MNSDPLLNMFSQFVARICMVISPNWDISNTLRNTYHPDISKKNTLIVLLVLSEIKIYTSVSRQIDRFLWFQDCYDLWATFWEIMYLF